MRKSIKRALSVVLASAMVMAMSAVTFADEAKATVESVKTETGYEVYVSTTANLESFDWGLTYDSSKVTATKLKWEGDFSDAYDEVKGIKTWEVQNGYDYIVFGGTSNGAAEYTGKVARIIFEVVEGADASDAVVNLVEFSKALKVEVDALGNGPAPLTNAPSYANNLLVADVAMEPVVETPAPTEEVPTETTGPAAEVTPEPTAPADEATAAPTEEATTAPADEATKAPVKDEATNAPVKNDAKDETTKAPAKEETTTTNKVADAEKVSTIKQLKAFVTSLKAKLASADLTAAEKAAIEAEIKAAEAIIAKGDAATEAEVAKVYASLETAIKKADATLLKDSLTDAGLTTLAGKVDTSKKADADKAKTADTASIVIPMIAICGAAAAVVVASKKRVEE